uniref:Uncharacterized protein n=1 Tax=Cannabis sativa TaxID=3483 RepID=A0A803PKY0_CANSA
MMTLLLYFHYDDFDTIFEKDRANGQGGMGFSETVDEIDREAENDQQSEFDPFAPMDDLVSNATDSHTSTGTTSAQSRKRSRKRSRNEDSLVDVLTNTVNKFGEIQVAAGDSIRRITDCFQFETEGASRRLKMFNELKKIDGLSFEQRIEAGKLLVQNQAYTDLLFTLDNEYKLAFVLGLFK